MHTLKKPFTLLLILSHLNAFVLGGVSNVHAATQVVDTTKSRINIILDWFFKNTLYFNSKKPHRGR
jgi:hypothetical protein